MSEEELKSFRRRYRAAIVKIVFIPAALLALLFSAAAYGMFADKPAETLRGSIELRRWEFESPYGDDS